jgi:hypothetical protein
MLGLPANLGKIECTDHKYSSFIWKKDTILSIFLIPIDRPLRML